MAGCLNMAAVRGVDRSCGERRPATGSTPTTGTRADDSCARVQLEDEKGFEAAKTRLSGVVTPVTGIGGEAVQATTQGIRTVLTVRKGNVAFAVSVMGLPVDQAKAAEQTLAKYAVSKL
jgi:hypothetical protein